MTRELSRHCLCDECDGDDCKGLKEIQETAIRNETLNAIMDCAETDGEWIRMDGTDTLYLNYSALSKRVESLRSTTKETTP